MTRIALTVPAQVASWVRPALTVAFLCVPLCPACADQMIEAIVDREITIELT